MNQFTATFYHRAEQQWIKLLTMDNLDTSLTAQPSLNNEFEAALTEAINTAYSTPSNDLQDSASHSQIAHLFLQRTLYRINRLKLFWYDDLRNYKNERSPYLSAVRDRIERAWQQWELSQLDVAVLQQMDVQQTLEEWTAADVDPPPAKTSRYFQEQITEAGYRQLLAIASLDGLVEASQLSRMLGGVSNEVQSVLARLLIEEYGGGRLKRKHSSFFMTMLNTFNMQTEPEAYFDQVPGDVLAIINHSFLLSERKRYFLRYIGGLLYGELTVPAAFRDYRAAGERLGLSDDAMSYWDLHIKVDQLHGQWMLEDVALPLIDQYPEDAWEMLLGYSQQKYMSARAGDAVMQSIQQADRKQAEVSVIA